MKKNLLESKMKLHGDRQSDLADAIGISLQTFNKKLNGNDSAGFTQSEIKKIIERYNLTADEVMKIFFD